MPKTMVKVGPADHGKRMSLEDFDKAKPKEGYIYELNKGVIVVSDVPGRKHFFQVDETRQQLASYRANHINRIFSIASGSECKLLLWDWDTERHPDIVVYCDPPPLDDDLWAKWIPDIVIEIVSLSSIKRDYKEKREDYLHFGVREYWIVDINREEMLALRRRANRWRPLTVRPPETYSTKLLPGFELKLAAVFHAANRVGE